MRQYGIPWELIEEKMIEDIENTFDDEKFPKKDPDFRIDAAYARKEFGDKKPELIDFYKSPSVRRNVPLWVHLGGELFLRTYERNQNRRHRPMECGWHNNPVKDTGSYRG